MKTSQVHNKDEWSIDDYKNSISVTKSTERGLHSTHAQALFFCLATFSFFIFCSLRLTFGLAQNFLPFTYKTKALISQTPLPVCKTDFSTFFRTLLGMCLEMATQHWGMASSVGMAREHRKMSRITTFNSMVTASDQERLSSKLKYVHTPI